MRIRSVDLRIGIYAISPIVENLDMRVVYDLGIDRYARVSETVDRGEWRWPSASARVLMMIRGSEGRKPSMEKDKIILMSTSFRKFGIHLA